LDRDPLGAAKQLSADSIKQQRFANPLERAYFETSGCGGWPVQSAKTAQRCGPSALQVPSLRRPADSTLEELTSI
jgi:hypothetical protein